MKHVNYRNYVILISLFFNIFFVSAMPDSIFIQKVLNEYEEQRPQLERKIRKRNITIDKADSLYLIPTLLFTSKVSIKPSQTVDEVGDDWAKYATWDSLDVNRFYVEQFVVIHNNQYVMYDLPIDLSKNFSQYKIGKLFYYDVILDIIKERKPRFIFQVSGFPFYFFFVEDTDIVFYSSSGYVNSDALLELEHLLRSLDHLLIYGTCQRAVH